jgi:carboxymethylenebutenolidase
MVLDGNQKYLVEEFAEDYLEGRMGRREMIRRSLFVTGSIAVTAAALRGAGIPVQGAEAAAASSFVDRNVFATVSPSAMRAAESNEPGARTMPPAERTTANVVAEDDHEIVAGMIEFPGEAGAVFGYLARPAHEGSFPAIIVIHENRGLIEPNMDIARRYAKEGFVALAVDLISRAGGTAAVLADDPMAISGALGSANDEQRAADMTAGIEHLKGQPFVDASVGFGVTGFCFGGGQTFSLAARNPEIRAAVPYYGSTMPQILGNTNAAILGIYAEEDTRITSQVPDVRAALESAGKVFEAVVYPGANHAFFNNTGERYHAEAAQDAWRRTLDWFLLYLSDIS